MGMNPTLLLPWGQWPAKASHLPWTLPEPHSLRPHSPRPTPSLPGFPQAQHQNIYIRGGTSAPRSERPHGSGGFLDPRTSGGSRGVRPGSTVPPWALRSSGCPPSPGSLARTPAVCPCSSICAGRRGPGRLPLAHGDAESGGISSPQRPRGSGTHSLLFQGLRRLPGLRGGECFCPLPPPLVLEGAAEQHDQHPWGGEAMAPQPCGGPSPHGLGCRGFQGHQ